LITFVIVFAGTALAVLYAQGIRFNSKGKSLDETGMMAFSSAPTGAQVYVDGKLSTITNNSLQGLLPKEYLVEMKKEGYVTWSKKVNVFPKMVTDVTSLLISKTPRLDPITNSGIYIPTISNTGSQIAYTTKDNKKPGIWVMPFGNDGPVNLFRAKPYLVLDDISYKVSDAKEIIWSPDDQELLVKLANNQLILVPSDGALAGQVLPISDGDSVLSAWETERKIKRKAFIEKKLIESEVKPAATNKETLWSPDEDLFLYTKKFETLTEYHIYNLTQPLPIGEKKDSLVLTVKKGEEPMIFWHSDSKHLILVEVNDLEKKLGSISIVETDGGNRTEIFSGSLFSFDVFPTPDGGSILALTSFNPKSEPNLYAIGIR